MRILVPFFGAMRVTGIDRAEVVLWHLRRRGSNPCRAMWRRTAAPCERFLSLEELRRLGFVLDHAEDRQAAAVHLLLFTGARSSEIADLQWDGILDTRAVLSTSRTGPKAIQLPSPARAVLNGLNGLPRNGRFVFLNRKAGGPMADLGLRWQKLRGLAGLDHARNHDCRYTFASQAAMSGLDLYTAGRLLDHADVAPPNATPISPTSRSARRPGECPASSTEP